MCDIIRIELKTEIFVMKDRDIAERVYFICIWLTLTALGISGVYQPNKHFVLVVSWITVTSVVVAQWVPSLASIPSRISAIWKRNRERRTAENRRKCEEERVELFDRINRIVGHGSQTEALLMAIDRLTKYVPEMSERLLQAIAHDAERYQNLRALESSTENEVLRQKCKLEAEEISEAARKLCAETTEMALELLEEHESIEADSALGEVRGPALARAHADFKHYLEGLREALPMKSDSLRERIAELSPAPEVKKLPALKSK